MLSDSELEALIRGSVPRELPASLRRSLTRLLEPAPVRATAPMWMAITILLLSSLIIWFSSTGQSRSCPAEKAPPSAPVETKPTAHSVRHSCGHLPLDEILTPPQLTGRDLANHRAVISSSHLFCDTIPLPLRLHVGCDESKALVFHP